MKKQSLQNRSLQSNDAAIVALVLGILSVLTFLATFIGLILGALAIIFATVALKRKTKKKMAIGGLVTGIIGIVLSIIGFLLVLIAIPALRLSQQDTQVKSDASQLVSSIALYETNNQGRLPSFDEVQSGRIANQNNTTLETPISTNANVGYGYLTYILGTDCSGVSSERSYSLKTLLRRANEEYCIDN